MKINKKLLLVVTFSSASLVNAAVPGRDSGQINFFGQVSDVSCQVSIDGQGSDANVYLSPISLTEVTKQHAGAFLKPKPFNVAISNCLAVEQPLKDLSRFAVRWVGGNLLQEGGSENGGYLANSQLDGARNISLVLSSNGNSSLDNSNKILVASQQQVQVAGRVDNHGSSLFTYYVGYVTQTPGQVTSGNVASYATYLISYN